MMEDNLPYRWKDVRVFISSTFRDFHAERDYLVKFVFPELRQWCERYRLHLTDIDLRWGVTAAEAESGKVIDLCLEQIDGSRPFFVCMLGNRYGWVPQKSEIPPATLSRYDRLLETDTSGYSITHMEIHHAAMRSLASADEPAVAPDAFFYFRSESSVPQPEQIAFASEEERNEFRRAFYDQDPSLVARLSALKAEIEAHFSPDEEDQRVFHYAPVFDPSLENPEDESLEGRFTTDSLRGLGNRVLDDLRKSLNSRFRDRIAYLTKREADETSESELDLHERFVETRTRGFTGRTALLSRIRDYVGDDSREILTVLGETGSGKSSLLAQFYKTYKYDDAGNDRLGEILFIPHFIGASPGSTVLHNLLRRVCEEVKKRFGLERPLPTETHRLPAAFQEFLEEANGKVILLIDGLDQLDDSGESTLGWLPSKLGKNIKVIASTLPGKTANALQQKTNRSLAVPPLNDEERREIIRKVPSLFAKTLNEPLIAALLKREETRNPLYLKVALEELRIFGGFGRSGEKLEEYVNSFPSDVVDMFAFVLRRLEKDHHRKPGLVRKLFCLIESSRFGLTLGELKELLPEDTDRTHQVILRQMRDYLHSREETIDFFHRSVSRAVRKTYDLDGSGRAEEWHRMLAVHFMSKPVFLDGERRHEPAARKLAEQPWQQTASGMRREAAETLCDLWFVEAKVRAGMVHDLQEDYERLLEGMPEARQELEKEERERERASRWIREIIDYSRCWNDFRGLSGKGSGRSRRREPPKIPFPERMPSVTPETTTPGTKEESGDTTDLTRIKVFRQFLRVKLSLLARYGRRAGFVIQEAYNFVKDGPLGFSANDAAARRQNLVCLLNHDGLRSEYNPRPAIKRDFVETTHYRAQIVALTPDGRYATAGGHPVQAWDADSGAVKVTLKDHNLITDRMAVTPDGHYLLVPKDERFVTLWDLQKGAVISTFGGDTSEACKNDLVLTPDGRLAFLVDRSKKTVQMVDARTGRSLAKLDLRPGTGREFRLTADGRSLFYCAADWAHLASTLYVVNTETRRTTGRITGIPLDIHKLAVTSDGTHAAVCGTPFQGRRKKGRIFVYNLRKKIQTAEFFGENEYSPRGLEITDDGRLLFVASNGSLKVWDIERRALVRELTGYAEMWSLDITPDGRWALTGDSDTHLRLWDIVHGIQLRSDFLHKSKVNHIAVSCGGDRIALAGDDGAIKILDGNRGQVDRVIAAHDKGVTQCAFVPESGILLSGGRDRTVKLWDSASGKLVRTYRFLDKRVRTSQVHPDGTRSRIGTGSVSTFDIFVTPDSRRGIYGECGMNSLLRMIDLETGTKLGTLENVEDNILGLNLSAEGRLFYATDENQIQIIDLEKRVVLKRLAGHRDRINSLAITPDNMQAITGSGSNTNDDNSVKAWDITTGSIVAELASFENNVNAVAVSPDGRKIIAGGGSHNMYFVGDNDVRVWDFKSSKLVRTLSGHEHTIHFIRITPDAKYVITASFDDTVRIWDLDAGENVALFCGGKDWSSDYAMSDLFRAGEFCYWNASSKLMLLRPLNLNPGPQVATATRLWLYGRSTAEGGWDKRLTALCLSCGRRFAVGDHVLSVIAGILRHSGIKEGMSPVLELDAEAWNERGLLSACPQCGNAIRFNPFLNDASLLPQMFVPRPSGLFKKEKRRRERTASVRGKPRRSTELREI